MLIYPDYFSRGEPVKGMHGYLPDADEMQGFLMVHGPRVEPRALEEAEMVDVCATICHLLGRPRPPLCRGRSVLPATHALRE